MTANLNKLLPPIDTIRWVPNRKAMLVSAIKKDVLSFDDACIIYKITPEELGGWFAAVEKHGVVALRSTRIQEYRRVA